MKNCIFCQIAQKKLKSKIRFEDDEVFAFDDINPKAPVHILIIPKKHITNINQLTDEDAKLAGKLILIAQKLAKDMKISQQGFRLIFNQGVHSGQVVDHLHLHLLGGKPLGPMG